MTPDQRKDDVAHPLVICSACNDTHVMPLRGRLELCTRCPLPCQECRHNGNGPYCTTTPCPCACHAPKPVRAFVGADESGDPPALNARDEARAECERLRVIARRAELNMRVFARAADNEKAERVQMRRLLDEARAEIAALTTERDEARTTIANVTAERALLRAEVDALRADLLRMPRDREGYLTRKED